MQSRPGPWAVRLTLWSLLAASLAMALVQPAGAGTLAAPEVTDPAGDGQANAALGDRDLVAVWIDDAIVDLGEAGPGIQFNAANAADFDHMASPHGLHERIRIAFVPTAGLPDGAVEAYVNIRPGLGTTANSGEETASCQLGFAAAAGGSMDINQEVAGTASFEDAVFHCGVPLNLLVGFDPATGGKVTQLHATFELVSRGPVTGGAGTETLPVTVLQTYDTAPDEGFGTDWPAHPFNSTTPGDSDADGLNDTCEQRYFGNLTAANATGDADGDGLTNGQECALGTDPTKADTDGDGTNDKDDPEPTDPAQGGTSSTSTSHSSSTSTSRSSSTHPPSSTSKSKGSVTDFAGAVDRLQSDPGYVGMSAGGFLAVLVLCIVGLAVRWSL
jgi:hypothetical protein